MLAVIIGTFGLMQARADDLRQNEVVPTARIGDNLIKLEVASTQQEIEHGRWVEPHFLAVRAWCFYFSPKEWSHFGCTIL